MDFVKSGCETWADVQADNFSFEYRGFVRIKGLGVAKDIGGNKKGKETGKQLDICITGHLHHIVRHALQSSPPETKE